MVGTELKRRKIGNLEEEFGCKSRKALKWGDILRDR